jgi:nucleoid associated protein NdpA
MPSCRVRKGSRMETVTDIAIQDCFVIHVLDNRLPAVQCSQALTPLPETLRASLHRYLLALLKPQFRRKRYGRFQPGSVVLQAYQHMLASQRRHGQVEATDFLTASRTIATRLFDVMRQSPQNGSRPHPGTITPGDLLIGLFQGLAPQPVPEPWLFLIKVDLESALQRQIQPYGTAGVQTILTARDGLMPRLSTEKVQKFALIRFADDPSTYDVLMTDPQGGKVEIAKFFADDFLQTEAFRTADEQAELLFTRTYDWVSAHEEALSPQERGAVLESVRTLLVERVTHAEPVAPRDLVASLPLTDPRPQEAVAELRQSFEMTLTAPHNGVDSIPINRELRIQAVPRVAQRTQVTYELDFGVRLSGEQEAIERLFVHPPRRVAEHTELTIRTLTFRPVV